MQDLMRPKGVSLTQLTGSFERQGAVEARVEETYPEGTFEALLVIAVDRCKYLQELQDALLIVEIGYLFERLLNQLTESFSLEREEKGEGRGKKITIKKTDFKKGRLSSC